MGFSLLERIKVHRGVSLKARTPSSEGNIGSIPIRLSYNVRCALSVLTRFTTKLITAAVCLSCFLDCLSQYVVMYCAANVIYFIKAIIYGGYYG